MERRPTARHGTARQGRAGERMERQSHQVELLLELRRQPLECAAWAEGPGGAGGRVGVHHDEAVGGEPARKERRGREGVI